MNAEKYIRLFSSLGVRLSGFGGDEASRRVIAAAMDENPWFTEGDIIMAVEAIRTHILQPDILAEWLGRYRVDYSSMRDIAVIMAGNIPLVGFSDLLCIIAAGDMCHLKMSGKDSVLMKYVAGLLKYIDPAVPIAEYRVCGRYDAVIATGSDNTNRYFRSAFSGIPSLLRGSRSSVAVLGGDETDDMLRLLSTDVFSYSGLGCRNASLIFVPELYDIDRLGRVITPAAENINAGYLNNYIQNRALLTVKGEPFKDFGCFLMQEKEVLADSASSKISSKDAAGTHPSQMSAKDAADSCPLQMYAKDAFPMNISSVNYCHYSRTEEVGEWLAANDGAVQCVVANTLNHPRAVTFGQAHRPYPWDYPDGRDVMEFLNGLS